MKNPVVSVVLGSYNRASFLPLTIDSVRKEFVDMSHEIIVIDGGSDDGILDWLVQQKDVITIVQHNRGIWNNKPIARRSWGYFMNLGFKIAQGKYVCMLSDDCLVVPGAIKNGVTHIKQLLDSGRKIGALAFYWREWSKEATYHVNYTLGGNMYVNHGIFLNDALKAIDYCDEETFFFYNGDGDLCLKMKQQGYECVDSDCSYVEHYPHASIGVRKTNYAQFDHDLNAYLKKWRGIFYDPIIDNRGGGKHSIFVDEQKTGNVFLLEHKRIVEQNPALLQKDSVFKKVNNYCYWKYRGLVKKVLKIVQR